MDERRTDDSAAPRRWALPWPVALILPAILAVVLGAMLLCEPQRAAGATAADGSASRLIAPGEWTALIGDDSWVLTVRDESGPTMSVLVGHDTGRRICPVVDDIGTVGGGTWIDLRPADGGTASPAADATGCGLLAETVDNDNTGLITAVLSNGATLSLTAEGN
ncbi:hypothetical protein [Streptacidiphilus albus]|uniref:hypothetical protein n=1 Tax=Streptacidiphilus albus TaxID=105425 RepID=UPI00128E7115|nr:hypothetical protein [Streptacidiphilus albus]